MSHLCLNGNDTLKRMIHIHPDRTSNQTARFSQVPDGLILQKRKSMSNEAKQLGQATPQVSSEILLSYVLRVKHHYPGDLLIFSYSLP